MQDEDCAEKYAVAKPYFVGDEWNIGLGRSPQIDASPSDVQREIVIIVEGSLPYEGSE